MAARTGSVHLIFSVDQKPNRKGGRDQATPKTALLCASRTTILNEVLTGHRMSTGSPQSIPIKPHSFLKAKTHKHFKVVLPHRSPHFLCGRGTTHRHDICFKPSSNFRPAVRSPSITPAYSASLTDTDSYLTSCHAPKATWQGFKGQTASTTHPSIASAGSCTPISTHWLVKPCPIGSNKTCINTHTQCLERAHMLN